MEVIEMGGGLFSGAAKLNSMRAGVRVTHTRTMMFCRGDLTLSMSAGP